MKYETKIVGWGEEALSMLGEEFPLLVIFDQNAPPELAEICLLHERAEVKDAPKAGDILQLGDNAYPIVAVGDEVLHTLRKMGHCTLMFKDDTVPEMPGCLMLRGKAPSAKEIKKGMTLAIR
jgi:PTS system glucitol/sorbitol-specific IIA component